MYSFKDFLNSTKNKQLKAQASSQELAIQISGSVALSTSNVPKRDNDKFGLEVARVANSDDLLTELSNSIGSPKELESEDEFVNRSKSTLVSILKRKLMK